MMETNRTQLVKMRFLREFNIKVLEEWLSGCVTFCLQENPQSSNESLFQFAFSQWLLADLNDVGIAVLPADLDAKVEQHTLKGSFPVQIQYLLDISEPAYDQWRALYDKKLDEADEEVQMRRNQAPTNVKKRRMLKLHLTDGKQTIVALEHSSIKSLTTKLAPGTKLLLSGPIRCINKVLLLQPQNVRVLGGEVDVLLIMNAYENVLLRLLNKPANPNPKLDYEEAPVSEGASGRINHKAIESISMERDLAARKQEVKPRSFPPPVVDVDDVDDSLLMGIDLDVVEASQPMVGRNMASSKPEQVQTISTLMDDDDMDDIVQLVEEPREPEIMNQQVSSTKHSQSSPSAKVKLPASPAKRLPSYDDFIEDDIDMMNSLEDRIQDELRGNDPYQEPPEEEKDLEPPPIKMKKAHLSPSDYRTDFACVEEDREKNPPPTLRHNPIKMSHVPPEATPSTSKAFKHFNASDLFEDSMDCLDVNEPKPEVCVPVNILSPNYPFRIDDVSLVTIEQIMAVPPADRCPATFIVYCEVNSVTEQPRIRKNLWHLTIELSDHSSVGLPVRLHDTVLTRMTGHEAAELMRLHKTDRTRVMQLLDQVLHDFKELLQEIKCFWRVVYEPEMETPVVMETYEMSDERGAILLDKIIKENCGQLRKML
uniref:RecQ-mediated genome instability protein 1 n=1 Tax=Anopheles farauti TaxID=69004 RepID=A0A182QBE2_9DIPT